MRWVLLYTLGMATAQRSQGFRYVLTLHCFVPGGGDSGWQVPSVLSVAWRRRVVTGLLAQPCVATGTWNTVIVMRIEF